MNVKDLNIKNRTNYFFNHVIYIEKFNPNNIKTENDRKIFLFTILDI